MILNPGTRMTFTMTNAVRSGFFSLSSWFARAAMLLLAAGPLPAAAQAPPAAGVFRQLDGANARVERTLSLASLGIDVPPAATAQDGFQEFYFPVPAGVPLEDVVARLKARYIVAGNEGAILQLRVDGKPVGARTVTQNEGELDIVLPLHGMTSPSGFVRLGLNWLPVAPAGLHVCQPAPVSATTLSVSPDTGIAYRYQAAAPASLRSAWGALPASPVLRVAHARLARDEFDTAWRVATVLERAGRRVRVRTFPVPGDTVDTTALSVPAGLASIPAFAALAHDEPRHTLKDQAEIGALLALDASRVVGDVVVDSPAMRARLDEALDALAASLSSDAAPAFGAWRDAGGFLKAGAAPADLRLARLGGSTVIAVAAGSGSAAAALGDAWRGLLLSGRVDVGTLATAPARRHRISLRDTGASFDSFEVVNQGRWRSSFALDTVTPGGSMPSKLVLDVAVAPDASGATPVVSVLLNGVLLTADTVRGTGEKTRMTARIPGYALRLNNTLEVVVQRLPTATGCATPPKGYPVNVLPTSHLELGKPEPDGSFVGLLPLLADSAELIVPEAWLEEGAGRIPQVSRLALASGLSVSGARLVLAQGAQAVEPSANFVAMASAVSGTHPVVSMEDNGRLRVGGQKTPWLDVSGLSGLVAVETASAGKYQGLLWHGLDAGEPAQAAPYSLERGNVAIIGPQGAVAMLDSADPQPAGWRDHAESAFYEWRHYISWGVPLVSGLLLLFVIVLALAYRAGRRRARAPK